MLFSGKDFITTKHKQTEGHWLGKPLAKQDNKSLLEQSKILCHILIKIKLRLCEDFLIYHHLTVLG